LLPLLSVSISANRATAAGFYVATNGSDAGPGTLAEPFSTLERAREAVRDLKKQKPKNIEVHIRGSTYRLDKTLVFSLEDSGDGEATVTYAAYSGETPVFSSGKEIAGWQKASGELPRLPKVAQGK
jgi:hypothetical protein